MDSSQKMATKPLYGQDNQNLSNQAALATKMLQPDKAALRLLRLWQEALQQLGLQLAPLQQHQALQVLVQVSPTWHQLNK
jgi:hypothetical protein